MVTYDISPGARPSAAQSKMRIVDKRGGIEEFVREIPHGEIFCWHGDFYVVADASDVGLETDCNVVYAVNLDNGLIDQFPADMLVNRCDKVEVQIG